jgi:hypothetical protein
MVLAILLPEYVVWDKLFSKTNPLLGNSPDGHAQSKLLLRTDNNPDRTGKKFA